MNWWNICNWFYYEKSIIKKRNTMTSHQHHKVSNYWQFHCLFSLACNDSNIKIDCRLYTKFYGDQSVEYVARSWHHQQYALQWRHNACENVSNHQLHDCLLNRLFRRRSKKTSKFRVTGLCAGNSARTGEFPAIQRGPVNSRANGQQRGKCFHLMTSSWLDNNHGNPSLIASIRQCDISDYHHKRARGNLLIETWRCL